MKIALICFRDNCNRTYKMQQALRAVGVDADGFRIIDHPYQYPNEVARTDYRQLKGILPDYTHAWFTMGDKHSLLHLKGHLEPNQKVYVTYSGTKYRQGAEGLNKLYNSYVTKSIILGHDLMDLGAKDPVYFSCRIFDTDSVSPKWIDRLPLTIGHFPSNADKKGTYEIISVLQRLKLEGFIFKSNVDIVPTTHNKHLERIEQCDVVIDQLFPMQGNRVMGEMGNATFEIAGMGKVVVTNLTEPKYYEAEAGDHPFVIANDKERLYIELKRLLMMPAHNIKALQQACYNHVKQHHSYQAMGRKMMELL